MKKTKRFTVLLLSMIMLFSIGVSAFAADGEILPDEMQSADSVTVIPPAGEQTPVPVQTLPPTPSPDPVQTIPPTPSPSPVQTVPNTQARAVIGADLTADQVALVYQAFGIPRGSVIELTVSNAEERQYLEGYVDNALIGTRSISCVYVQLKGDGSAMDVTTSNINWCTPEMYISALATAGITDAKIVVAAPFEVSGTAALTGIYKAYEDMTGKKLDSLAKLVSTQELTITGELAQEIGSMDSTYIVQDLKLMLDETRNMTDEEIRAEIIEIAARYNVKLTDTQINQLISLCRSLEGLDSGELTKRVQEVQNTLSKVSNASTKVTGFVNTVKKVVTSVQSFFDKIKDILDRF